MHSYKFINSKPYLHELIDEEGDKFNNKALKIASSCLLYNLSKRLSAFELNCQINELESILGKILINNIS